MAYSKLKLDRNKIIPTIKALGVSCSEPIEKGIERHIEISYTDEPTALLVLYYNQDATTTISVSRGKNQAKSKEIADLIVNNCSISDAANTSLYFSISETDFNSVIEYLVDECNAKSESKIISGGIQHHCVGEYGDKLTIKFFSKKGAMQVQGKPIMLYSDLIEILCELLPYEQVVKPQFESINVKYEPNKILDELQSALPHAYDFLHQKTKSVLTPSLALRRINIELDDYSLFVMPALRGLEAYIKQLFAENGIIVGRDGFKTYLTGKKPYSLNSDAISLISCPRTVKAIEDSYSFLSKHRNGLFHADGNVATTMIIENRSTADQLLNETLLTIDSSYALIMS
jgi:hypothetical protein